jgi:hypothetical protein
MIIKADTIFQGCGIAIGIWCIYKGIRMCREEDAQIQTWDPELFVFMGVISMVAFGLFMDKKPIN